MKELEPKCFCSVRLRADEAAALPGKLRINFLDYELQTRFFKTLLRRGFCGRRLPSGLTWALPQGQAVNFPGEEGMILRSFRFVDLESPVEYFNTWLTPIPHFFVRNHMHEPSELDATDPQAKEWRLSISGEVGEATDVEPRRTLENRNALRRQHARMRRKRTQPISPSGPRHSVGKGCSGYCAILWSSAARTLAARRSKVHGQACHVPRPR